MERVFTVLAAILGAAAVALGAFAAHGLKPRLSDYAMGVFQTGVQYHMTHALALLAVALLCGKYPEQGHATVGWLFVAGIVVFSGSLYALALTGIRALGAITPLGGLMFLAGWLWLAVLAWRGR